MADLEKASQKAREFKQREEEVLRTALDLFLELGEDRVTVEMIAEKVGIGKGTIYKHFETKDEIYLLLMIRYEEEMAQMFQRLVDSPDNKEQLAREFFLFRIQDPKRYTLFDRLEQKMVASKAVPELLERLHRIRASNAEKLTRIVTARIKEGVSYQDIIEALNRHGALNAELKPATLRVYLSRYRKRASAPPQAIAPRSG